MCRFCVEHGEGQRWYLNARNYAYDLESDLRRRDYVVGFVRNFADMRRNAIGWMERLNGMPEPVTRAGKALVSRNMRTHHFGQPLPLEDCRQVLDLATSITIIPCICRMHEPGKRAEEVCILVTTQPIEPLLSEGFKDYEDGPDLRDFRRVSADGAMRLLEECEQRGLMHSIWTFQTPFTAAICNCNLESGCMAMRLTQGYEMKLMWRGECVARLDEESCTGCGSCSQLCPFDAIERTRAGVAVRTSKCWGCGVCRSACQASALRLVDRRGVPEVAALW